MREGAKKFLGELFKKYKHIWVLSYMFIYFPWFYYLETHVTKHFNPIHMAIDDYIPFLEVFIIPYMLWFVYIAITIIYFFFHNKSDYYHLCAFLIVGMTVFLIISTLYPNGHYLRPQVFERDNIFVTWVKKLYLTDTPTNLFPSIHVYNSIGVHIAILRSKELKNRHGIHLTSWVLMISIVLSTMFLKQHSVFDVLTAFLMAGIVYTFVYVRSYEFHAKKSTEPAVHKV